MLLKQNEKNIANKENCFAEAIEAVEYGRRVEGDRQTHIKDYLKKIADENPEAKKSLHLKPSKKLKKK